MHVSGEGTVIYTGALKSEGFQGLFRSDDGGDTWKFSMDRRFLANWTARP